MTQPLVAPPSVVVDAFDSVSQWRAYPSAGVEMTIHSDTGRHGQGMRLDFDFHGHGGYAVAHRDVMLDLPANYQFGFAVRGDSPPNTLEFKLIDGTPGNTWWSNNPNFDFPHEWRTITREKQQICFAWGPAGAGDIRHVAGIAFAITAGSGGKGRVWFDDLVLTPLPQRSPYDPIAVDASRPLVGRWQAVAPSVGAFFSTVDFRPEGIVAWSALAYAPYAVAGDQLTITTTNPRTGVSERQTSRIRIAHDTLTQDDGNGPGTTTVMTRVPSAMPGHDSIIGVWAFTPPGGGTAFVDFMRNGQLTFRLPTPACAGSWTDSGDGRVTLSISGQVRTNAYVIAHDSLTMRDPQGRAVTYTRKDVPD